jgi:hypothetical protein
MKWIQLPNSAIEIGATPVTWVDYARFAWETGHPVPKRQEASVGPVTGVTSSAARAFAEWLSQRDRRHYRLPTLDEMCDIAYQTCQELSLWPCRSWDRHQVWRQAQDCLSEWLDCSPTVADGNNSMNCITHPAWLLNN